MDYNFWLFPFLAKTDKCLIQFIVIGAMPLNKKEVADDLEFLDLYSYQVTIT